MKHILKGIALFFMIVTGLLAGTGLIIIDRSLGKILDPVRISEAPEFSESLDATKMKIKNKNDETISALYVNNPESDFVILFLHSGRGHLFDHLETIKTLTGLGFSILAPDYRGFGLSDPADISDETLIQDVIDCYGTLRRRNWRPHQIVYYSQGISSGIVGQVINEHPGRGWIMDNPIPSLSDAMTSGVFRFLTKNRLSLYNSLEHFEGNILVGYDPGVLDAETMVRMTSLTSNISFCVFYQNQEAVSSAENAAKKQCLERFVNDLPITPGSGVRQMPVR